MKLLSLYNNFIQKRPQLGTSVSTSLCYCAGDYLAQKIEIKQGKRKEIDYHRLGVFTLFGLCMAGPIYYQWFNKLNKVPALIEKVVKYNETRYLSLKFKHQLRDALKNDKVDNLSFKLFKQQFQENFNTIEKPLIRSKTVLVTKIYLDQFVFSILYPIFFMVSTGVLLKTTKKEDVNKMISDKQINTELIKNSFKESIENVKKKFINIYITDCAVWPLVQMANFAFIPPHMQPIFVNGVNIFWNAFLCYSSQDGH